MSPKPHPNRPVTPGAVIIAGIALIAGASQAAAENSAISNAVSHPDRTEADVARDSGRNPAAVLEFFNAAPGDKVIEMGAGGGYYTELLSRTVGDSGYVYSYNPFFFLRFVSDEMKERYQDGALGNVTVLLGSLQPLGLPSDNLDAAYFINTYHDAYFTEDSGEAQSQRAVASLREIHRMLKPGGIVAIVDHRASSGMSRSAAAGLHRIPEEILKQDFLNAGFQFIAESDVLKNSSDERSKPWFGDPVLKDATDRLVMKFRKPE